MKQHSITNNIKLHLNDSNGRRNIQECIAQYYREQIKKYSTLGQFHKAHISTSSKYPISKIIHRFLSPQKGHHSDFCATNLTDAAIDQEANYLSGKLFDIAIINIESKVLGLIRDKTLSDTITIYSSETSSSEMIMVFELASHNNSKIFIKVAIKWANERYKRPLLKSNMFYTRTSVDFFHP